MKIPAAAADKARGQKSCIIRLTDNDAAKILEGGLERASLRKIRQEHLTRSGAKLYPLGGGWFRLSGYHYSGQDVCNDLIALQNPVSTKYCSYSGMKYSIRSRSPVTAGTYPGRQFFDTHKASSAGYRDWCRQCQYHKPHQSFQEWLTQQ